MVEVQKFYLLKRPLLTKKARWFFVTLRGGKCDICHTFFFFEGFPDHIAVDSLGQTKPQILRLVSYLSRIIETK